MTPVQTFAGRRVALFGLGGSGLSTARALIAGGAIAYAAEQTIAARLDDHRSGRHAGSKEDR